MKIKESRERLSLTQGQLAEKLGVSIRTVQSWEMSNPKTPNRWIMRDLVALFNSAYKCQHCKGGLCKSVCADEDLTNKEDER